MGFVTAVRETWRKNAPEAWAAVCGGLPGFVLARRPQEWRGGVPAFCYHTVNDALLRADLTFLRDNGYVTIDADALLAHMRGQQPAPPRAVVLTFDDGSANLFEVTYPLLREFGMCAVAFVAPAFHRDTIEAYGDCGVPRADRPCTWEQLRQMQRAGVIDVQSHTFEHRYLPRWPRALGLLGVSQTWADQARGVPLPLADDLAMARRVLEQKLDKRVRHLAFPDFRGSRAGIQAGVACGYEGFWWGSLPGVPGNGIGGSPQRIARLKDDWLKRLPGEGRRGLFEIISMRLPGRRHG